MHSDDGDPPPPAAPPEEEPPPPPPPQRELHALKAEQRAPELARAVVVIAKQ